MTIAEQTRAVAEWCGWKWYRLPTSPNLRANRTYRCLFLPALFEIPNGIPRGFQLADMTESECNERYLFEEGKVAHYDRDLNAVQEAVLRLDEQQQIKFVWALDSVTGCDIVHTFPLIVATAAQRLEALCRVLWPERWKD